MRERDTNWIGSKGIATKEIKRKKRKTKDKANHHYAVLV